MMRVMLFWGAIASLIAAIVVGSVVDPVPRRERVMRGGWRVIEADFHVHTRFSDGFLSPFGVVLQARRRGLDAIAITEHNMVFPAKMGRWFSRLIRGPLILVGSEITRKRYHLIGVGMTERVESDLPLRQVIRRIHAQGGVVIAAHPVKKFWPAFDAVRQHLDAAEVVHPIAFNRRSTRWRWSEMVAFYRRSPGKPLAAIGSSDYHFFSPLGVIRTLLFVKRVSAPEILEAIRRGRTVVVAPDGAVFGDPALIALLRQKPYSQRRSTYNYQGVSWLDRASRFLGWLALWGLLIIARPTRRATDRPLRPIET